jgi:hypothetical protein
MARDATTGECYQGMTVMLQGGMAVLPNGVDVLLVALPVERSTMMLRGWAVADVVMELQGMIVWVFCPWGG